MKWSPDDLKKLARLYPVTSNTDLEREFAPRSLQNIVRKARELGAKRRRNWKAITAVHTPVIFRAGKRAGA